MKYNGKVKVDETKCTGCGVCNDACDTAIIDGAIKLSSNRVAVVDKNTCIDCGLCCVVYKTKAASVCLAYFIITLSS